MNLCPYGLDRLWGCYVPMSNIKNWNYELSKRSNQVSRTRNLYVL